MIISGCSEIEPQSGTRIVYTTQNGSEIPATQRRAISSFLKTRGRDVLSSEWVRLEKFEGPDVILLLPGLKVDKKAAQEIIRNEGIEFYHLTALSRDEWSVERPEKNDESFIFKHENGVTIDALNEPDRVMDEIVGEKPPFVTGSEVQQPTTVHERDNDYAVKMRFNESGKHKMNDFILANKGEYIGMFYNGRIAYIAKLDKPLDEGTVYLTGFATPFAANVVKTQIEAGSMPVELKVIGISHY